MRACSSVPGWRRVCCRQARQPPAPERRGRLVRLPVESRSSKIQGSVYLLAGPSGNTVVQVGEQGVLVVDTQGPGLSDQVLAAIRTLSNEPIHYIVNTQAAVDHTGGNETLARLGPTRPGRVALADGVGGNNTGSTSVIAHENVLNRMSGRATGEPARPEGAWPTDTFFGESTEVFFNGEGVQVRAPAGRPHRWRQPRLLPPIGRDRRRRRVPDHRLSGDRSRARRQRHRPHRRAQPHHHAGHSRPTTTRAAR